MPREYGFIAYMDVLGVSDLMQSVGVHGDFENVSERVQTAIATARIRITDFSKDAQGPMEHRILSDSILVAALVGSNTTPTYLVSRLHDLCYLCAFVQLLLAEQGFFLRGAITYGETTWSNEAVLGPPIVEAVRLEQEAARQPRIILSPKVLPLVLFERTHATANKYRIAHCLVEEEGDCCFIDALGTHITLFKLYPDELDGVGFFANKARIASREVWKSYVAHAANPSVRSKYAWMIAYWNFVVTSHELGRDYLLPKPADLPRCDFRPYLHEIPDDDLPSNEELRSLIAMTLADSQVAADKSTAAEGGQGE